MGICVPPPLFGKEVCLCVGGGQQGRYQSSVRGLASHVFVERQTRTHTHARVFACVRKSVCVCVIVSEFWWERHGVVSHSC